MNRNKKLKIKKVVPAMGIAGGDITIYCEGLNPFKLDEESLIVCGNKALIEGASEHKIKAHIPEDTAAGEIIIHQEGSSCEPFLFEIPLCIAHTLHNVGNPAVLANGTVFATFSGTKGQLTPASVFKIPAGGRKEPFIGGIMNATSLLRSRDDSILISSRYDGKIYQADSSGEYRVIAGGLGEVFGIAQCRDGTIFAGDRTGNIFRISDSGKPDFFAHLPASEVAYHLAVDSQDRLYVSAPLHIGENIIYRITPDGTVDEFYKDLVEFHGLAVDSEDNLLIAVTNRGKGAVHHLNTDTMENRRLLSGEGIIGLSLHNESGDLFVATFSKLYVVTAQQLKVAVNAAEIY